MDAAATTTSAATRTGSDALDLEWRPSGRRPIDAAGLVGPDGVVEHFSNLPPYYDEPRLFHLTGRLAFLDSDEVEPDQGLGAASGASLDRGRATAKMFGEACERLALVGDQPVGSELRSFDELDGPALDPDRLAVGTAPSTASRRLDAVQWCQGFDSIGRSILVPTQLIDVPYFFEEREELWRAPITTGAAAGSTLEEAAYSALCEVVERDAFMCAWLLQCRMKRLDVEQLAAMSHDEAACELLLRTYRATERYLLGAEFFSLPNGVPLNTVMCVLRDASGLGAPVIVGAKSSPDPALAALGALEEAHQVRPWTRHLASTRPSSTTTLPRDLRERALLWFEDRAVELLEEWLDDPTVDAVMPTDATLGDLVDAIERQGATVAFVDLTPRLRARCAEAHDIYVVKAAVPEFQPLYLTEELRDVSVERLRTFPQRSQLTPRRTTDAPETFPHPFL